MSCYSRECKQTAADSAGMLIGADVENRTIERERPCYSETFWGEERKSRQRNVTMASAAVGKHGYLLWNGKGHGLVRNPLLAKSLAPRVSAYKYSGRFRISAPFGKLGVSRAICQRGTCSVQRVRGKFGTWRWPPTAGAIWGGGYFIMVTQLSCTGSNLLRNFQEA